MDNLYINRNCLARNSTGYLINSTVNLIFVNKNQSWQFMSLILYAMAILIGVGFVIFWIWENTISRFNNWLDAYKGNKAFDKWKQDNTKPNANNI